MSDLDRILARLEQRLGPLDGPPVPLDGGITNRNYRIASGRSQYLLRVPGRDTSLLGISRASERDANNVAAQVGIAPRLVAADDDAMVTEFIDGVSLEPVQARAHPEPIARALRAFHDVGVELPVVFWVPELLERYERIVSERGGTLPPDYAHVRALADRIGAALPLSEPVPCHNDLLPANIISNDGGATVQLVDWEYAGMGHRLFDLGNVAVNSDFDQEAEDRLLTEYFGEPPGPTRRAALKLMRLMSDAREGAWGVVQGVISELDFDFAAYARNHFDRLSAAAGAAGAGGGGGSRLEEWLDAAAA